MQPYVDVTGAGPAVVFLHAAIADRRMWHPQWQLFAPTNTLLRIDLRGFGDRAPTNDSYSNAEDVLAAMNDAHIDRALLVGNSLGAGVAAELAVTAPERVAALVLIAPAMAPHEWSLTTRELWRLEEEALDRGDIESAVSVNLDYWLDGPNRDRSNLTATDRELVAVMQRRTFELELAHPDAVAGSRLPDLDERLSEIAAPTTVLYGTEDAADIAAIAQRVAGRIPGAVLHRIADTAHLPSLEAPDSCNPFIAAML